MTDTNQSSLVGNEAGDSSPDDHSGQPGSLRRAGHIVFRIALILGGLFLLFLLGMMLMSSISPQGMASFRDKLAQADSVLVFLRLGLIGLLITLWHPLNTWFAQHNCWSEARLQRVLAGRLWTLVLLLFVELILVQRLHETVLGMVN